MKKSIYSLNDRSRRDLGYNKWVKDVKSKYNYICQVCGSNSKQIIAHHLYSYRSNPKLRTDIDNGVCLCVDCHDDFHIIYNVHNNTKEQFVEFKKTIRKKRILYPVISYCLYTKTIKKFSSISAASKSTNIRYNCILWCCLGKRSAAGDKMWRFRLPNIIYKKSELIREFENANKHIIYIKDFNKPAQF